MRSGLIAGPDGRGRAPKPSHHASGAAYATWLQRAGAELVDGLILVVPSFLLVFAMDSVEARFTLSLVLAGAYNGLLDGSESGQTVGKRLLRIRTVDAATGGTLGLPRGLGRAGVTALLQWLGLAVPLAVLVELADVLWPLWDPQRQTLHDKAAGSVVVRVDDHAAGPVD